MLHILKIINFQYVIIIFSFHIFKDFLKVFLKNFFYISIKWLVGMIKDLRD